MRVCEPIQDLEILINNLNFGLEKIGYGLEQVQLRRISDDVQRSKVSQIKQLKGEGHFNMETARRLGVSEESIRNWLKREEGR